MPRHCRLQDCLSNHFLIIPRQGPRKVKACQTFVFTASSHLWKDLVLCIHRHQWKVKVWGRFMWSRRSFFNGYLRWQLSSIRRWLQCHEISCISLWASICNWFKSSRKRWLQCFLPIPPKMAWDHCHLTPSQQLQIDSELTQKMVAVFPVKHFKVHCYLTLSQHLWQL